jgi:anti-anti-sigma factor
VSNLLRIAVERERGFVLGRLSGELTLSNTAELSSRLEPELEPGDALVLDLTELTFLDSAGIHCIFRLARSRSQHGGAFRLVVPPDAPSYRILQIVDPGGHIPVHATAGEATSGIEPQRP